jgi:hypothetical protein
MALPDKDFYSLSEIATRWGCDDTAFLSYASRDILIYAVYLRDLGSYQTVAENEAERVVTRRTIAFAYTSSNYQRHSINYLKANDARRILESRPLEEIAVSVLFKSTERTKASGMGYSKSLHFTKSDLIISREERDRFEKSYRIATKSGRLTRAWIWLRDSENQKPLVIVGGAIAAVATAAWTALQFWIRATPLP